MDYNGMTLVKAGSRPISGDDGLNEIKAIAESGEFLSPESKGEVISLDRFGFL